MHGQEAPGQRRRSTSLQSPDGWFRLVIHGSGLGRKHASIATNGISYYGDVLANRGGDG